MKEKENEVVVSAKNKNGAHIKRTLNVRKKEKEEGASPDVMMAVFKSALRIAFTKGMISREEYALLRLQAKIGSVVIVPLGADEDFAKTFSNRGMAKKALKGAQVVKQEGGFLISTADGKKYAIKISACK